MDVTIVPTAYASLNSCIGFEDGRNALETADCASFVGFNAVVHMSTASTGVLEVPRSTFMQSAIHEPA